jgi:heparan-alpha-glucosaminide N-acetyltransferase
MQLHTAAPGAERSAPAPVRYVALDSMRGFVMLALVSGGFGLGALSKDPRYERIASQFHHLDWEGAVIWELIMPAFMFMVGASLPFALARRIERGAGFAQNLKHVTFRALRLILLGQFLTTLRAGHYQHEPYETLTQLGISYFFAFLILSMRPRWQPVAAGLMLAANWALYVLFPGSEGPFSPRDNIGVVIDQAVFGLDHAGSWATINFLGSSITVLFGAWSGALLRSRRSHAAKLKILAAAIAGSFAAMLAAAPLAPLIHKAWTITFTFWHTGCVLACLLVFFWLFDVKGYTAPARLLIVAGMNSIFIYMASQMLGGWINRSLAAFTGRFEFLGGIGPAVHACAAAAVLWYCCWWLYRRKIFFKV